MTFLSLTVRRARAQAEPESHNYLASAADLMIGLLFIFIIMVAFLAHQRKVETAAREAAEIAAQDAMKASSDPRGIVTKSLGERIQATWATVRIDPESGIITLPEDLLFDRGSAQLKPEALVKLGQVATSLSQILPCYVANQRYGQDCPANPEGQEIDTLFIEGHTDSIPMLREGGNLKLSLDRAVSMGEALVEGTALKEYRNQQGHQIFSYSAYGDTRPIEGISPEDGRNRRVDLRIVLAYHPYGVRAITLGEQFQVQIRHDIH